MKKVVLVCGGRDYKSSAVVSRVLTQLEPDIIIEGGATGADRLARIWGKTHGVHVATVDALWDYYGNAAGPIRNSAMLLLRPTHLVAFPGGTGTADMVRKGILVREGIQIIEITDS